jgi:SWI/SNF-related matrix-associated actin-dependent regulator of chromatin subfamily A3
VVLDEAHLIANRHSLQSKAVVALSSTAHWIVTGTPIQNKLEDLYPICAFLRIHPLDNFDFFHKLVVAPMRQRSPASMVRVRKLMQVFCLRRTKNQQLNGQPIIILPPKTIEVKC